MSNKHSSHEEMDHNTKAVKKAREGTSMCEKMVADTNDVSQYKGGGRKDG